MPPLILLMCAPDFEPVIGDFEDPPTSSAIRKRQTFSTRQEIAAWLSRWPDDDDGEPWLLAGGRIESGDEVWDLLWPGAALDDGPAV